MEAELPLKRFPDSSISFLILIGRCVEGHPTPKNIPLDRQLPDST